MKWTSVLRRMPDANQIVLVYVPGESEPVWLAHFDDELPSWAYPSGATVTKTVTHWMELPQPPGERP